MNVRKGWPSVLGLLLLVALVVTACSRGTPTPETMMEKDDSDAMMEKETPEAMMEEETPEAMMEEETPEAMMEEETPEAMMENDDSKAMMDKVELALDVTGVENLGAGWAYEGWLIVDGAPVSTGVFAVDDQGIPSATSFAVAADDLDKATAFVLTIESAPDPDPAPSVVHVLAGDLVDGVAELRADHVAALGNDFSGAATSYILGIPSSDSANDSYTSGIWFDGLNLPELPDGWVYEGWVVGPDGPISTGRFASKTMADSDGTGPTAGPKGGPNFPGQDFLNPPIDLTGGYAVVISIEPEPDNSSVPFFFKPLIDKDVEDVGDHGSQSMENIANTFPNGQVTAHH
jgi:hypothetical protein